MDDLLKLENQICFPVYAASRLITRLYQPMLEELELTYPQYLVMLLLWEKDHRNVSDLSKCLYLESNTLTPLLKRMEQAGFIQRSRSSEDERVVLISLTKTGAALKEKASKVPEAVLNKFSSESFNEAEIINFKQSLQAIIQLLS